MEKDQKKEKTKGTWLRLPS